MSYNVSIYTFILLQDPNYTSLKHMYVQTICPACPAHMLQTEPASDHNSDVPTTMPPSHTTF